MPGVAGPSTPHVRLLVVRVHKNDIELVRVTESEGVKMGAGSKDFSSIKLIILNQLVKENVTKLESALLKNAQVLIFTYLEYNHKNEILYIFTTISKFF